MTAASITACVKLTLGGWKTEVCDCSLVHCVGLGSSDPLKLNPLSVSLSSRARH